MSNEITVRFINCHNYLVERKIVHNSSTLAKELGIHRQFLSKITNKKGQVTLEIIQKMIDLFHVNPLYLFGSDERMFISPEQDHKNIEYLPAMAFAGETVQFQEDVHESQIALFTLPGTRFESGDYRAFSISGDSMEPDFKKGDLVICSRLSKTYYERQIKKGGVYVLLTQSEIFLKRFHDFINRHNMIFKSDNEAYQDIVIKPDELNEIWKVEARLTEDIDLQYYKNEIVKLNHTIDLLQRSRSL
jgi:signal peptidase I